MAIISFNPNVVTVAKGMFTKSSKGVTQGTAYPDPAVRYALTGGTLDPNETLPMWGGCAIYSFVPGATGAPDTALGPVVGRATGIAGSKPVLGFSVFDQDYSMIQTPQSQVPVAYSTMEVNFYPLGSRARIAVKCDPGLAALEGGLTNAQVSWDFAAQQLVSYAPAYNAVTITGATWASTAGGQTTYTVGTDLTAVLSAGDAIDVSGVVSTGGTGVGYNGTRNVVSVDSTHVVVTQAAAASPGTYSSGGTIAAGGGALPVTILEVMTENCQVVDAESSVGNYVWDFDGACAIIRI